MASCDMCSKQATTKAKIEGVILSVCASCASFGSEVKPVNVTAVKITPKVHELAELDLVVDFGKQLRAARVKKGLNEEDAAKQLGMHKSTLLHFEAGKMHPDEAAIRKLEKFFGIRLRG